MTDMDWATEDSEVARRVLTELGHAQSVSLEPGDYTRDKVAKIISEVRRKAKAQGMLEAAEMIKTKLLAGDFLEDTDVTLAVLDVSAAADKLQTSTD